MAKCPLMKKTIAMQASLPTTLRRTDGRHDRVDAPKAKGRAFQPTAKEVKVAPNFVVGTFIVNSMFALVLFDLEASHSFVSLKFSKGFNN